jgi:hypothetical protein
VRLATLAYPQRAADFLQELNSPSTIAAERLSGRRVQFAVNLIIRPRKKEKIIAAVPETA